MMTQLMTPDRETRVKSVNMNTTKIKLHTRDKWWEQQEQTNVLDINIGFQRWMAATMTERRQILWFGNSDFSIWIPFLWNTKKSNKIEKYTLNIKILKCFCTHTLVLACRNDIRDYQINNVNLSIVVVLQCSAVSAVLQVCLQSDDCKSMSQRK